MVFYNLPRYKKHVMKLEYFSTDCEHLGCLDHVFCKASFDNPVPENLIDVRTHKIKPIIRTR